jgi:hypothetical protein
MPIHGADEDGVGYHQHQGMSTRASCLSILFLTNQWHSQSKTVWFIHVTVFSAHVFLCLRRYHSSTAQNYIQCYLGYIF